MGRWWESLSTDVAIERGNAYLAAGADCVFVPGFLDDDTVAALVKGINGPVNILLSKLAWDTERLNALGVRRLSIGSAMARWSYGNVIEASDKLMSGDTFDIRNTDFTLAKSNAYFEL